MGHRAHELVRGLELAPHPEGGWYREVFRAEREVDPLDGRLRRSALTAVYFLLAAGQHGRWHRVDADEVWTWIEGAPLRLHLFDAAAARATTVLVGPVGELCEPVRVAPAGVWQAAEPVGEFALVSCAVGPGFDFADFRFLDAEPEARARLVAARPDLLRLV